VVSPGRRPSKRPPSPLAASSALALPPSPAASSSPATTQQERRARLEEQSIEALIRQKAKLQAQLDKLEEWRSSVGGSFQLAWQEERAAHQRDMNTMTRELTASQERTRQLQHELEQERALRQHNQLVARQELDRSQAETAAAKHARETLKKNGGEQLKALQRQLAQARREKAALCDEFVEKLERLGKAGGGGGGGAGGGGGGGVGGGGLLAVGVSEPARLAPAQDADAESLAGSLAATATGGGGSGRGGSGGGDLLQRAAVGDLPESYAQLSIFHQQMAPSELHRLLQATANERGSDGGGGGSEGGRDSGGGGGGSGRGGGGGGSGSVLAAALDSARQLRPEDGGVADLSKEASMLFERFEKGGSDGGGGGGGGGGGARASPQKRGGVGPVAPAARPGAAERKENIRRAHAPVSQQEAIDNMKLAQQLRAAERDLDKVRARAGRTPPEIANRA